VPSSGASSLARITLRARVSEAGHSALADRQEGQVATELNDTKRIILATAAARTDLRVLPIPETIKVSAATVEKSLKQMVDAGLLAEIAASAGEAMWRKADEDGKIALIITDNGLAAIGIETNAPSPAPRARTRGKARKAGAKSAKVVKRPTKPAKVAPRASSRTRGTKQNTLIAFLRRANGASIAEMMKATGWQAHSLRGVMSGSLKKKLGLDIISEKNEKTGERRYHIAALRPDGKEA
jgi:hypothetical protein